ncbi:MAG TPA: phosphopantothenoylcysteine decarboxylase [Bacteroidales bacterium]|nr:phosphopantothenoylcysteine decarboxylase [Bacteroidales bacterium]
MDPVRFISNYSSGKMGIALADAAVNYGADVTLVLGPTTLSPLNPAVNVIRVTDAASMAEVCIERFKNADVAILAAAVADYTPAQTHDDKMKKSSNKLTLTLKPTIDIAESLGKEKRESQIIAGFALETSDEMKNAQGKLRRKNLDLVVLNSLRDKGAGFEYDTNKITVIDKYNNIDKFELKTKDEAAKDILDKIVSMIK